MATRYVIKAGDSLESIAQTQYKILSSFRDIADANDLDIFSDTVTPGQVLELLTIEEITQKVSSAVTEITSLDLSGLKQPETVASRQLISWIIAE